MYSDAAVLVSMLP